MKRSPECRRDYDDDTLLHCLDNGIALLEVPAMALSGDDWGGARPQDDDATFVVLKRL